MVYKTGLLVILSAFLINAQIMLNPNRSGILNPSAGGAFDPSDLNPFFNFAFNDSVVASGSNTVLSVMIDGREFTAFDSTNNKLVLTDSSVYSGVAGTKLNLADTDTGSVFNMKYDDLSADGWFWFTDAPGYIFAKFNSYLGNSTGYQMGVGAAEGVWANVFTYHTGTDLSLSDYPDTPRVNMFDNGWHHIAWVLDRDAGIYIYINGNLVMSYEGTDWTDVASLNMISNDNPKFGNGNFGHINSFRMYKSALTSSNITDLYNYGKVE